MILDLAICSAATATRFSTFLMVNAGLLLFRLFSMGRENKSVIISENMAFITLGKLIGADHLHRTI